MSDRPNPFDDVPRLFDRMARQFQEAARSWETGETTDWTRWTGGAAMAVDLVDRDDEFVVTVDLPGFDRDDVDVRVTDRTLHIDAERESETGTEAEGTYLRRERRRSSEQRTVRLPADVDEDDVTATMTNGVLTVTLPKAAETRGHRISVE
jgi:HSP20 family protein